MKNISIKLSRSQDGYVYDEIVNIENFDENDVVLPDLGNTVGNYSDIILSSEIDGNICKVVTGRLELEENGYVKFHEPVEIKIII